MDSLRARDVGAVSVPDYCEPILGWRVWNVATGGGGRPRLFSAFATNWPPHEALVARHGYVIEWGREGQPVCPGILCTPDADTPGCGIYAYKTNEYLRLRRAGTVEPGDLPLILGQVALWGTVVEHAVGYRATLAYPHRFVYAHHCDGQQIAKTYGVPYQEDPSWKSALRSDALPWSPFRVPSQYVNQIAPGLPPFQMPQGRLVFPPQLFPLNAPSPSPPSPPVSKDDAPARARWLKIMKKRFGI